MYNLWQHLNKKNCTRTPFRIHQTVFKHTITITRQGIEIGDQNGIDHFSLLPDHSVWLHDFEFFAFSPLQFKSNPYSFGWALFGLIQKSILISSISIISMYGTTLISRLSGIAKFNVFYQSKLVCIVLICSSQNIQSLKTTSTTLGWYWPTPSKSIKTNLLNSKQLWYCLQKRNAMKNADEIDHFDWFMSPLEVHKIKLPVEYFLRSKLLWLAVECIWMHSSSLLRSVFIYFFLGN